MKTGIVRRGDADFIMAINKFERRIERKVWQIIVETAEIIATQAKALAPVDTGGLRKSIEVEYNKGLLQAKIIVGSEYGIYVNYGTGIYSVKGTGRKTPWTYFSPRLGRFVTTEGMKAQMFWEPAVKAGARYFESSLNRLGR